MHFLERIPVVKRRISVSETLHYRNVPECSTRYRYKHSNLSPATHPSTCSFPNESRFTDHKILLYIPQSMHCVHKKIKLMVSTRRSYSLGVAMQVIPQKHMGSRGMPPLNLSLETRRVVSFKCPSFTSREKSTWHPLSRMGGTQGQIDF
jgi:hypothetical protein